MTNRLPILILDQDQNWTNHFSSWLVNMGYTTVDIVEQVKQAKLQLQFHNYATIIIDINTPNSEQLIFELRTEHPEMPIIVVSASTSIKRAVKYMQLGVWYYFSKSSPLDEFVETLEQLKTFTANSFNNEDTLLANSSIKNREIFENIITGSRKMIKVFEYIESVALSSQPVLITGESGTGKEMMAKAVHNASGRPGPFVPVNIAGVSATVFDDTIFGHTKGAFTDAREERLGLVEVAKGGTLFLDEIGDLEIDSQVKLLRLLQEKEFRPLGSDHSKKSDVRIVAATNKTLTELQDSPNFRSDLYYRLGTHAFRIPALSERKEDIQPLLDHFLAEAARDMSKTVPSYPPELIQALKNYQFPGNIRELRALVFDAIGRHRGHILSIRSFEERMNINQMNITEAHSENGEFAKTIFGQKLNWKILQKELVDEAMARADNNQSLAAKLLGMSQQTLNRHLKQRDKYLSYI